MIYFMTVEGVVKPMVPTRRESVAKNSKHLVPMLSVGMHILEFSKG